MNKNLIAKSMKTCSLDCCKRHKQERSCDGQRDKTKYVNKQEFDENVILSDYKFLEEQARLVDLHQRGVFDCKGTLNDETKDLLKTTTKGDVVDFLDTLMVSL